MLKINRFFVLTLVVLSLNIPVFAQSSNGLTEDQLRNVLELISEETMLLQQELAEAQAAKQRILELRARRAQTQLPQILERLIAENDYDSIQTEFDKLANQMDVLIITNPDQADSLYKIVSRLFREFLFLQDNIDYYGARIAFYKNDDLGAITTLEKFFTAYPTSDMTDKAAALYIKVMLYTGQEPKALEFNANYPEIDTPEVKYLIAQAYFNIGDDTKALAMFRGLQADPKFGEDALLMSRLIVAINSDIAQAIQEFAQLERVYQNEPFILLALARMHVNAGNWTEAENYYRKYYSLISEGREILTLYEMALAYLNAGKKDVAHGLLTYMLEREDTGVIYSSVLYLWSELEAEAGKVNVAKQRIQEYVTLVYDMRSSLPRKTEIFQRIDNLKQIVYDDPSPKSLTRVTVEVETIKSEFTKLHEKLTQNPTGLTIHSLNRLYQYELSSLVRYLMLLNQYVQSNQLRFMPMQAEIDRVETLRDKYYSFTRQQEAELTVYSAVYDRLIAELQRLVEDDRQLKRQIEIRKNIAVYDMILTEIDKAEKRGIFSPAQIESIRTEYQAKKQEMELLYAYYDYDMKYYDTLATEIELLYEDNERQAQILADERSFVDARRDYLVEQFRTIRPAQLADQEMIKTRDKIESQILVSEQYLAELDEIQDRLTGFNSDISFIDLQLAYWDLWHQAKNREMRSADLSFEEAEKQLGVINQQRKQLYDRIVQFIRDNPNFTAFVQPSGYGNLIGISHLYYNLAELHYAMYPTDPEAALSHYHKVIEVDPTFYLRDAVQYNIGFISNFLLRSELDNAIDEYYDLNPLATTRPDNLRYSEQIFSETINAFKDVHYNFKDSPHFDESTYRLGTLYFQIGADADEPIRFYEIARNYFNVLVNNESSPYYYEALYQRGWTYLNSNTEEYFKLAIGDFIQILQAIDDGKITDPTEIKDYLHMSIQNIGYCLTAMDGTDFISPSKGAQFVLTNLSSFSDIDLLDQMIDVAIKTKLELQAPMQAIDFMRVKAQLRPLALNNPTQLDSILTTYYRYRTQLRPGESIEDIRYGISQETLNRFNRDSEWFIANKNREGLEEQLVIIRKAYDDVEFRLNNDFMSNPTATTYAAYVNHIDIINRFREIHGDDYSTWYIGRRQNIIAHGEMLARTLNDPITFINTINSIYEMIPVLESPEAKFNYEGLAFRFAKIVNDSLAVSLVKIAQSKPELNLPNSVDSLYEWYKSIAHRFLDILISDGYRSVENVRMYSQIMFELADKEFDNSNYINAASYYTKLLEIKDQLTRDEVRGLYIQLARIAELDNRFAEAENRYRQSLDYAQNAEDRAVLYSMALYQIQRIVEDALSKSNYELAATQYLRLASEFRSADPTRSTAYKIEAHKALIRSNQYQASIDILLQVASEKIHIHDVYVLYHDAWNIADSLMNDKGLALKLQNEFMERYPSSNETFLLRVSAIERMAQNAQTRHEAADQYLDLHQDAVAKRIDTKDIPEEQIYLWAIDIIQQTNDGSRLNQLLEGFIDRYPKHYLAVPFMVRIADYALAQGDTDKSDRFAKAIFLRDKSNFIRYENVAKRNLAKIAVAFESAFRDENWTLAFAKRDEFKKVEAEYEREGLNFDFKPLYAEFENAKKAFDIIQARNAYNRKFDTQMTALKAGFVKRRANDLMPVIARTTWKNHLTGGRSNLLAAFKKQVTDEINKVIALIQEGRQYDLDNTRTLRAITHIAAINEFAADVVKTQIDRYIEISWEIGEYRNRRNYTQADYDYIVGGISRMRDDFAREYLNAAYVSYVEIYDKFYLAGYRNLYTEKAKAKLEEWYALPPYKVETYLLADGWEMGLEQINSTDSRKPATIKGEVVSPNGQKLSVVDIPPNHELVLNKSIRSRVAPEFGLAHIVYPFDANIKINNVSISSPVYTRIDTLDASQPFFMTQFSIPLLHELWAAGINQIEMRFPNKGSSALAFHFALKVVYDTRALTAAIPLETIKINTDTRWDAFAFNAEQEQFAPTQSVIAKNFHIPMVAIDEMSESQASPIWVAEAEDSLANRVMFKRSFIIDTEFREGFLMFVAPQSATVLLNGNNLGDNYGFMFDPDPFAVFPNMVYFDASQIIKGRNEVQVIVNNASDFRGFLAEISLTILGKEEQ